MPVNLVKVEAQSDYATSGKPYVLNIALMSITETITYVTDGVELDLTDINADLVAGDVHNVLLEVDGSVAEAGVENYVGQWISSSGKLKIQSMADRDVRDAAGTGTTTATIVSEVSNAASITTNFKLTVFYVEPGTNA